MYWKRLLATSSVFLALGVTAFACSDDDSTSSEAFVNDYCDLLMPCCAEAGLSSDPSSCRMMLSALTAGAEFDQSKADACLSAMRAASSHPDFCSMDDDVLDDGRACDGTFSESGDGSVPPGGQCDFDSDCASSDQGDAECHHYYQDDVSYEVCMIVADGQAGSTPCIGTRTEDWLMYTTSGKPPELGYVCDKADGLYCDDTETCAALRKVGESCTSDDDCEMTAFCDSSANACAPRHAVGQPCTSTWSDECVTDAYCDETTSTCQAKREAGDACTSYEQCKTDDCTNEVCRPNTDIGLSLICGD